MSQILTLAQAAGPIAAQLPTGAFFCVGGETPNVMTMAWGGLSFFWGKHVFVAPVRTQRATYPRLEKEMAFTLCVPHVGDMARELHLAGTLSGRDGDKFAAIGLKTRPAKTIDAPVIEGCAVCLECRVLARNAFTMEGTDLSIRDTVYKARDFLTLFFGEVLACYGDAQ
jgi:flavin reductase (DIM6/NTAB) family NADH-FMN oxidoreductase RutF